MIIITGATGFIGSNIVAALNAMGRTDLLLIDDIGETIKWRNIAKRRFTNLLDYKTFEFGDVPSDTKIEAVLHLGADSSTTVTDGDHILRCNFHASINWWNWCSANAVPLIYASSAATYGNGENGFKDNEDFGYLDSLRPLNLYGWSKHQFDKWAVENANRGHKPPQWAGLKFFNVFGPNEYHKDSMMSLVAKNTQKIALDEEVQLFCSHNPNYQDGEQLRDFIYVKECAAIIIWLMANPKISGLFNVGNGKAHSFKQLMIMVGKALNKDVNIKYIDMPEEIRPNYQYFTEASLTKLTKVGYVPLFSELQASVSDYVTNYLTQTDKHL